MIHETAMSRASSPPYAPINAISSDTLPLMMTNAVMEKLSTNSNMIYKTICSTSVIWLPVNR